MAWLWTSTRDASSASVGGGRRWRANVPDVTLARVFPSLIQVTPMPHWCGSQWVLATYALLLSAALGCGGGTEPPEVATLQAVSGDAQIGVAGRSNS